MMARGWEPFGGGRGWVEILVYNPYSINGLWMN